MQFVEMEIRHAKLISQWEYDGEYSIYSFSNRDEDIDELMNGDYHACTDLEHGLLGYVCVGKSAQIPVIEGDLYPDAMLDIGIGMRPDLCGRGMGRTFFSSAVLFVKNAYGSDQLRLTVADFNRRAIKVYESAGFQHFYKITHAESHEPFDIMCLL